jgi:hypothetical protein
LSVAGQHRLVIATNRENGRRVQCRLHWISVSHTRPAARTARLEPARLSREFHSCTVAGSLLYS